MTTIELLDPKWLAEGLVGGGDWLSTGYGNHVAPDAVPALVAIRERLASAGYEFVVKPVHVVRNERTAAGAAEAEISYRVVHRAIFHQGEGALIVEVCGGGATLEEAVMGAQTQIGEIRYIGAPVASGQGQANACREIARQLYAAHGAWLSPKGQIIVRYHTRGGRGGWFGKIAERRFDPGDLQQAPVGGRYYCTKCGQPTPRNRQHWIWDDAAKTYNHTSRCCDAPVQRGKPADSPQGGQ